MVGLVLMLLPLLQGCQAVGYVAEAVGGGKAPPIRVTAEIGRASYRERV